MRSRFRSIALAASLAALVGCLERSPPYEVRFSLASDGSPVCGDTRWNVRHSRGALPWQRYGLFSLTPAEPLTIDAGVVRRVVLRDGRADGVLGRDSYVELRFGDASVRHGIDGDEHYVQDKRGERHDIRSARGNEELLRRSYELRLHYSSLVPALYQANADMVLSETMGIPREPALCESAGLKPSEGRDPAALAVLRRSESLESVLVPGVGPDLRPDGFQPADVMLGYIEPDGLLLRYETDGSRVSYIAHRPGCRAPADVVMLGVDRVYADAGAVRGASALLPSVADEWHVLLSKFLSYGLGMGCEGFAPE